MRALAVTVLAGCFSPHAPQGLACPDNWCPPPQQCVLGVCEGGGSNHGSPDARSPDASFGEANYMFVTSQPWVASQHAGTYTVDADAFCTAAGAALRAGTYMAWLDNATDLAASRIMATGARGWIRPDGAPFADTVADIVAGKLFYPPRIDELRRDTVAMGMITPVVTAVPADCGTGVITVGGADGVAPSWLMIGNTSCSSSAALYCFEVDRQLPVSSGLDRGKRIAFLTANTYMIKSPATTQGIDDLDNACAVEGAVLDTSRTYLALVAQIGLSARSRFDTTSTKPWAMPNGVVVATDLSQLLAPIDVTPMADHVPGYAQFGAATLDAAGVGSANCADWRVTSGVVSHGTTTRSTGVALSGGETATCSALAHIYCLEH